MKKKLCICGSICILLVCGFLIFIANNRTDDNSEKEDTTNTYDEDVQYVYYLEDEAVRNDPLFHAFVKNEIAAYDLIEKKDKYLIDYYEEYLKWGIFYGVHYMAEDLDSDGEEELLIFWQYRQTDGKLFVFDKVDGKLNTWEVWEDFLTTRRMESRYYGNGIFSIGGSSGDTFGYYNSEGRIEYIMDFSRRTEYRDGVTSAESKLVLYKDGIAEKEITYEEAYDTENDCFLEITEENKENKEACDSVLDEIKTKLGEGKRIRHIEELEEAEQITLEELLESVFAPGNTQEGIY